MCLFCRRWRSIKKYSRCAKRRCYQVTLQLVVLLFIIKISSKIFYDENADIDVLSKNSSNANNSQNIIEFDLTRVSYKISKIKKYNEQQKILNDDIFKALSDDQFVLVVQVHNNSNYLEFMVKSLEEVVGISTALIVFAIKDANDKIRRIINAISFAKTLQILYPYSVNLFPNVFPGSDELFCADFKLKCEQNCTLRHATETEEKHYWWWIVNEVFDRLIATKFFNGTIIFLEEDDYLLKDALHVAYIAKTTLPYVCPQCDFILLGASQPKLNRYPVKNPEMAIVPLGVTPLKMGFGFNRTVWNKIKEHREQFCFYGSSDWMKSLQYIGIEHPGQKFYAIIPAGPRVFKVMPCDDENKSDCEIEPFKNIINIFCKNITPGLFPKHFKVKLLKKEICSSLEEDYSWEDIRDKDLCMYISD